MFGLPLAVVVGGGVVLLLLLVLLRGRSGPGAGVPRSTADPQIEKALRAGHYEVAALRAIALGDTDQAIEYYVRAQQLSKAASLAHRGGRLKEAAELYERAGDDARAASLYRQLGLVARADELAARAKAGAPEEPGKPATPTEQVAKLQERFDQVRRAAERGDANAPGELRRLGEELAERWLELGDVRRAAEASGEAGLVEQSVNLYANLLGDPGAAARVLARAGEHRRAAELYTAAGERERAVSEWIDFSRGAKDPLVHLPEVKRLGADSASQLLEAVERAQPLAAKNVDLHYRIALEYELLQHMQRALDVLRAIQGVAPAHRDVPARIDQLAARVAVAAAVTPAAAAAVATPVGTAAGLGPAPALPPADAQATPAAPRASGLAGLDRTDLEQLVNEVAVAAAARVVAAQRVEAAGGGEAARAQARRGIEGIELELRYVADAAVRAAKDGPAAADLVAQIGGRPVDFENIEFFYRAGLAAMASGRWADARQSFAAVSEFSPGYRDASKRMHEIDRWQEAVAATQLGVAPAAGAAAAGTPAKPRQRYLVLGELGRGGMAVVYRARDLDLNREVAIKFLAEEADGDATMLQLFKREARAVGMLAHPNIVQVYDVGVLDGRPFICMELVDGATVEHLLDSAGHLKVLEALQITEQLLAALEFAHAKKIVHRDIKPANLMRNRQGHVKLMDFGLAKSLETSQHTTVIAGTPPYMPPERLAGVATDPRSDLFAVGVSLFEMLTGRLPYEGLRRDTPPPAARTLNPAVPKLLESVVARALELEPSKRFQSASEMLAPLRQILALAQSFVARHGGGAGAADPAMATPALAASTAEARPGARPAGTRPMPAAAVSPAVGARAAVATPTVVSRPVPATPAPAAPAAATPAGTRILAQPPPPRPGRK